jgi:hypothetical protein
MVKVGACLFRAALQLKRVVVQSALRLARVAVDHQGIFHFLPAPVRMQQVAALSLRLERLPNQVLEVSRSNLVRAATAMVAILLPKLDQVLPLKVAGYALLVGPVL